MNNLEQISQAIRILLMEYEYVIVPDLGGFITQYQSAKLLEDKGFISPPQRKLSFNAQLKNDDGLLVNFLSRFYQIDIKEAQNNLKKFTQECFTLLDKGAKVKLNKIGFLVFDKELNIQFSSFEEENFNPYSYGLVNVSYQKLNHKESLIVKKKKIQASKYYSYAAVLLPLILIFWISSIYLNKQGGALLQNKEIASVLNISSEPVQKKDKEIKEEALVLKELAQKTKVENALFYTESKNIEKATKKQQVAEKVKKELTKKEVKIEPLEKQKNKAILAKKEAEKIKKPNKEITLSAFQLVAGSFKNKDNAYRLSKKIKALDYPAIVIKKGNRYRVIAVSFDNRKEAKKAKTKLKAKKIATWLNHQK